MSLLGHINYPVFLEKAEHSEDGTLFYLSGLEINMGIIKIFFCPFSVNNSKNGHIDMASEVFGLHSFSDSILRKSWDAFYATRIIRPK